VIEEDSAAARPNAPPRKMVTEGLRKSLTKQGYRIVGTHSGVKLCRWTKSMLRGRGGCYKHTFYGISSYQCMESTPSLACANKCVFCWRHHKNPVGTTWRWQTDDPEHLISGFMNNHKDLIKTMRGLSGVYPSVFRRQSELDTALCLWLGSQLYTRTSIVFLAFCMITAYRLSW